MRRSAPRRPVLLLPQRGADRLMPQTPSKFSRSRRAQPAPFDIIAIPAAASGRRVSPAAAADTDRSRAPPSPRRDSDHRTVQIGIASGGISLPSIREWFPSCVMPAGAMAFTVMPYCPAHGQTASSHQTGLRCAVVACPKLPRNTALEVMLICPRNSGPASAGSRGDAVEAALGVHGGHGVEVPSLTCDRAVADDAALFTRMSMRPKLFTAVWMMFSAALKSDTESWWVLLRRRTPDLPDPPSPDLRRRRDIDHPTDVVDHLSAFARQRQSDALPMPHPIRSRPRLCLATTCLSPPNEFDSR